MKKILGMIMIGISVLGFGTYADVMPEDSHWVSNCVSFLNTEIDDYRLVVVNKTVMDEDIYEPQADECLKGHYHFGQSNQYLVEKTISLDELTSSNIEEQSKAKWELDVNGYYVNNSDPLTQVRKQFRIINKDGSYELETVSDIQKNENVVSEECELSSRTVYDFLIALLLTILLETIILFIIKLCKGLTIKGEGTKQSVKSSKVLLAGIIASSITLPLLWYVFPMFLGDGLVYEIGGELLVFMIEIVILKYIMNISRTRATIVSFVCNLASCLLGLLVNYLFY